MEKKFEANAEPFQMVHHLSPLIGMRDTIGIFLAPFFPQSLLNGLHPLEQITFSILPTTPTHLPN
jgi:hypothetical protein